MRTQMMQRANVLALTDGVDQPLLIVTVQDRVLGPGPSRADGGRAAVSYGDCAETRSKNASPVTESP